MDRDDEILAALHSVIHKLNKLETRMSQIDDLLTRIATDVALIGTKVNAVLATLKQGAVSQTELDELTAAATALEGIGAAIDAATAPPATAPAPATAPGPNVPAPAAAPVAS